MKLISSVLLLGSMGMLFTGCVTNPTISGTPQSSPEASTPQVKLTKTTEGTEVSTDNQKLALKFGDISEIKDDKTCDDVGDILVYAETKSYLAYICENSKDISQATYFKVFQKNQYDKNLEGEITLSWDQKSFVGVSGDYSYKLDYPSQNFTKQYLSIRLYNMFPMYANEQVERYLLNTQSSLNRKFDNRSNSSKENPQFQKIQQNFSQYIKENPKEFSDWRSSFTDKMSNQIFDVGENKYILALLSGSGKNPIYTYWLNTVSNKQIKVESLQLEYQNGVTEKHGFSGLPSFDPDKKVLAIHYSVHDIRVWERNHTISRWCGTLYKYRFSENKLRLQEVRDSVISGNCSRKADKNYDYIDPHFYPIKFP